MSYLLAFIGLLGILFFKHFRKNVISGKTLFRDAVGFGILLFGVAAVVQGLTVVPAGSRYVVFNKMTGVQPVALGEGLHVIIPIVEKTIPFSVRVQKESISATASSKDLQVVTTAMVLNFNPLPEAVPILYQRYGLGYKDTIVVHAAQEALKSVTALYTAEELVTKRKEVKDAVQVELSGLLSEANLVLAHDGLFITNFEFSDPFNKAIEAKQVQEQKALEAERKLAEVEFIAQQRVATARAEAESLRLQKSQITPALLDLRRIEAQVKAIEKWDGVMPKMIMGGDSIPLISIQPNN